MNKTALKERTSEGVKERAINTRFGTILVDPNQVINFPLGLLGVPQEKNYYLSSYPDKEVQSYSLLQSVEYENLCFLTIPLADEFFSTEDSLLAKSDILYAKEHYNIKGLAVFLIATIHNNKKKNTSRISVNLKAPILIDTEESLAYQHVFVRKEYSLKYFLN